MRARITGPQGVHVVPHRYFGNRPACPRGSSERSRGSSRWDRRLQSLCTGRLCLARTRTRRVLGTAASALTFPVVHARARLLAKKPPAFEALGGYDGDLVVAVIAAPGRTAG